MANEEELQFEFEASVKPTEYGASVTVRRFHNYESGTKVVQLAPGIPGYRTDTIEMSPDHAEALGRILLIAAHSTK